jgi:hypothetical protein
MERLTSRIDGKVCYSRCEFKDVLRKLADYEDAEEQGLLLRLPVAIGSTIYHFEYPTKIDDNGTEWSILDNKRATIKPMKFALFHLDSIGKLYFLTKEEAEQALKQMGE